VRLALFDLDNTLLAGDSDHAWGDYLCERGILDGVAYKARNDEFYQDYLAGRLDINDYLNFSLEILGRSEMAQLAQWHREFMRDCIEPIILAKGEALLAEHREAGDQLLIITATNRFVTGPIAARLGVETLLATECEMHNGRYSGRTTDVPCFKEGKVTRLNRWLTETGMSLEGSSFYSDSMNDLPLLEQVSRPVAVDPDPRLQAIAEQRGWPVISLR
jgi:HAD superfamily hydrolase (TIGR01490 family)